MLNQGQPTPGLSLPLPGTHDFLGVIIYPPRFSVVTSSAGKRSCPLPYTSQTCGWARIFPHSCLYYDDWIIGLFFF